MHAISHNTVYRMWDACMDDPSLGVTLMSQLDGTSVINQEYLAAGDNALANAVGELTFGGIGTASQNLTLDKDHQFVSAVLMLAPSVDHMVGVADLRLCDGDQWKTKVKVCLELFSTATVSTRVAGEMERNSLQANNCSFGYVEFTLLEVCYKSFGLTVYKSKVCTSKYSDGLCRPRTLLSFYIISSTC